MRRIEKKLASYLFALGVAASMSLGVATLVAQPAGRACPVSVGGGQIGLACTVHGDCTAACQASYPESPGGRCNRGCCTCLI